VFEEKKSSQRHDVTGKSSEKFRSTERRENPSYYYYMGAENPCSFTEINENYV